MQLSPLIAPAYRLGIVSRLQLREEESRRNLVDSLRRGDATLSTWSTKVATVLRRVLERTELHGERTREISERPLSIQLNNDQ